jgi:DNA-binding SARP family transcriptional activator/tetratricopeptide (TPR) repeat protein
MHRGESLTFTLLGEVGALRGGTRVDIGPPQRRCVLAALAVDAGHPVNPEKLIGRIWGDDPPEGARSALYAHIARLRGTLWPRTTSGLVRRSAGYLLAVEPGDVDFYRFERLVERSAHADLPAAERKELLRAALDEWNGEPLSGLPGRWAEATRVRWNNQHVDAVARWSRMALNAGEHVAVIEALRVYLADYPFAEALMAELLRALRGAGRLTEAIDHYSAFRARLAHDLGISPDPRLQQIYADLLRSREGTQLSAQQVTAPAQLPHTVGDFVGRAPELSRLNAAATGRDPHGAAGAVAVVVGSAGVGKTTLALHWAHHVRPQFPDGLLYLDLQGFGPDQPTDTGRALGLLLISLGLPAGDLPTDRDARMALYRTLTADRRVLIVLDNARDAGQVRPLLPSSATSFTLVTSRSRLTSLVATQAPVVITVDPFSRRDSLRMLGSRIGADRVAAEPVAAERIVAACGGLPLALAVAAARIQEAGFGLRTLADDLADERRHLDVLNAGDLAGEVRAVISWSYGALPAETRRLFRLTAIHPGPDLTVASMSRLSGLEERATEELLRALTRSSLLAERVPGRYAMHSLLRAYAAEMIEGEDTAAERREALRRLMDYYVALAYDAARQLDPAKCRMPAHLPVGEVPPAGHDADQWLSAELPTLLAAARLASEHRFDRQTWQLGWSLNGYLHRRGPWPALLELGNSGVTAAVRMKDRLTEAHAHRMAADAATLLTRFPEATRHLDLALEQYRGLSEVRYQADVNLQYAIVNGNQDDLPAAQRHCREAIALYRQAGYHRGCARALNTLAWFQAQDGRAHDDTIALAQEALRLFADLDDPAGESAAWDTLGFVQHRLNHQADARASFERALALARATGDQYLEATVLTHLGDTSQSAGSGERAVEAWNKALDIMVVLGHHDAESVRKRIDASSAGPGA